MHDYERGNRSPNSPNSPISTKEVIENKKIIKFYRILFGYR